MLLRGATGVLVVVAAVLVARRWADRSAPAEVVGAEDPRAAAEPPSVQGFLRTLGGLSLRLLPEYVVVVVALGALGGPL